MLLFLWAFRLEFNRNKSHESFFFHHTNQTEWKNNKETTWTFYTLYFNEVFFFCLVLKRININCFGTPASNNWCICMRDFELWAKLTHSRKIHIHMMSICKRCFSAADTWVDWPKFQVTTHSKFFNESQASGNYFGNQQTRVAISASKNKCQNVSAVRRHFYIQIEWKWAVTEHFQQECHLCLSFYSSII